MNCVQKRVQTLRPFTVAPLKASLSLLSHDDRICHLILNDRDVFARKGKLRNLLGLLTPRQKAYFIACNTR